MGSDIIIALCFLGIGMCLEFLLEHADCGKIGKLLRRWLDE